MDKEKLRWAGIALMLSAIGALVWLGTGGGTGDDRSALNQIGGLTMAISLIIAAGLFGGALLRRRA